MNNLYTHKRPDDYMHYTKQTLASKCIALEELLIHNSQIQAENFDLQSKYQLLLQKYQSMQQHCTIITTQLESYQYNENRMTNTGNMGEKIEIYELEDVETIEKLNNFEIQVSELQLALQKKGREFDQLLSNYKQYQALNSDLVHQFRSSHSIVDHSSTQDDQEQIQVLQKEITRLNRIVCRLRYELSDLKTREMDEEWVKGKQGEGHQFAKTTDSSFKIFNMIQ